MILPETRPKRGRTGDTAADIMTSPAITAREEASVREVIQIITERKIKRLIIVDAAGRPSGIVSRIDVVRALEHV
jgi:CBS domain-containing protein